MKHENRLRLGACMQEEYPLPDHRDQPGDGHIDMPILQVGNGMRSTIAKYYWY